MIKKTLSKIFKYTAIFFTTAGSILILVSWLGIFLANGFLEGIVKMQELYSPYNFTNYIATIITFTPALAAYALHKHFDKK